MNIRFEQLNPNACKTYLFGIEGEKDVIIVDPLLEHLKDYQMILNSSNINLAYILETHTHADHISGAPSLKDITDAELIMHPNAPAKCPSRRVQENDIIKLGELSIKVIETPGHTQDSVSYILPGKILTGDALFLDDGGAGRDDLMGGDPGMHWESLQKILGLSEDLIVYPAHDYRNRIPSSLKIQKTTNPHLQHESKESFINYLNDLKLGAADWMIDVLKANYACARDIKAAWIPIDSPACEIKGTLDIGVNEQEIISINTAVLKAKIGTNKDLLLLDVREPSELEGPLGKIEGVRNISITKLISSIDSLKNYKNKEIVIICRSGGRAYTAAQILKQASFTKPLVLEGGMVEWSRN